MEYFEAENRKDYQLREEVERDLKMMKYNEEMKSLRSKRDRIKQGYKCTRPVESITSGYYARSWIVGNTTYRNIMSPYKGERTA